MLSMFIVNVIVIVCYYYVNYKRRILKKYWIWTSLQQQQLYLAKYGYGILAYGYGYV